jgi:hypothetical protein
MADQTAKRPAEQGRRRRRGKERAPNQERGATAKRAQAVGATKQERARKGRAQVRK